MRQGLALLTRSFGQRGFGSRDTFTVPPKGASSRPYQPIARVIQSRRRCQPAAFSRSVAEMNEATDCRSNRIQAAADSIGSIAADIPKIKLSRPASSSAMLSCNRTDLSKRS
jgi:hypothetical protein